MDEDRGVETVEEEVEEVRIAVEQQYADHTEEELT